MTLPVFSKSWVDAWARELSASPAYQKAARTWEGSILLEVAADQDTSHMAAFLDLWHGQCREARPADESDRQRADYVLSAPLATWKRILEGDLEPILAIMMGKVKLAKGNISKLTPYLVASKELVAAAGRLDSVFPD